jgi:hypothetical protein
MKPLEATDDCGVTIGGQRSRTFDTRDLAGAGLAPISDTTSFGKSLFGPTALQGLSTEGGV